MTDDRPPVPPEEKPPAPAIPLCEQEKLAERENGRRAQERGLSRGLLGPAIGANAPTMLHMVRRLPPTFARVVAGEWLRNTAGALIGIAMVGALATLLAGSLPGLPILLAPIGASAVLVFAVPASPLARPWSVIGGNAISAATGVAVALALPATLLAPVPAAALAVGAAIAAMSLLRCLHPPGGACALTAVLVGPQTLADGARLVVAPLLLDSLLLVLAAIVINRALGHSYPHHAHPTQHPHPPAPVPQIEAGPPANPLTEEDFDAVLADYGEVLDISRKDLEMLYLELVSRAEEKRAISRS